MASAQLGMLLGVLLFMVRKLAPQPEGIVILGGVMGAQLAWLGVRCWRKTGLPFVTAAMVIGAFMSILVAVLALLGQPFPDLKPTSWVVVSGGALLGPLLLVVESRANRGKWYQWAKHMEQMTAWDILRGRHIPQLRGGGA